MVTIEQVRRLGRSLLICRGRKGFPGRGLSMSKGVEEWKSCVLWVSQSQWPQSLWWECLVLRRAEPLWARYWQVGSRLPFCWSTETSSKTEDGETLVLLVSSQGARIQIWQVRSPHLHLPEQSISGFCALKGSKSPSSNSMGGQTLPLG